MPYISKFKKVIPISDIESFNPEKDGYSLKLNLKEKLSKKYEKLQDRFVHINPHHLGDPARLTDIPGPRHSLCESERCRRVHLLL